MRCCRISAMLPYLEITHTESHCQVGLCLIKLNALETFWTWRTGLDIPNVISAQVNGRKLTLGMSSRCERVKEEFVLFHNCLCSMKVTSICNLIPKERWEEIVLGPATKYCWKDVTELPQRIITVVAKSYMTCWSIITESVEKKYPFTCV